MSLSAAKSRPRVSFSIFARCAVIVAASTALVAATLALSSFRYTTELANDGLRAKGEAILRALVAPAGGAIRFGQTEALAADIDRLFSTEDGAAVAAIVTRADGTVLYQSGPGLARLTEDLARLASEAASSGNPARSTDGFLMADPVSFGEDRTLVGAVAVAWSPAAAQAAIAQGKVRILALAAAIFAAALGASVLYIRYSVTRPLREVGRAMKMVVSGDYSVRIPHETRTDEIGLMARDLEFFRGMMECAADATKAAFFQSAAFRSCRAPMILADRDLNITLTNDAFDQLMTEHADDLGRQLPGIDFTSIIGRNVDVFHRLPQRNREMLLAPGSLPMVADIRIGSSVHQLRINDVRDAAGDLAGYVVEWTDVTRIRRDAAVLRGLEATQVGLRFSDDWGFVEGSGQIAAITGGDATRLEGRSARDIVRPDGLDAREMEAQLTSGRPVNGRFRLDLGAGLSHTLDGSFSPILDARGRPTGYQLLGLDVTAQERALADAEAARATLEAAQRRVVEALRTGLARLREGDLTHSIDEPLGADYETLREDFNAACRSLGETVLSVGEVVETIRSDVREIVGAAEDLSRRTEHQAATLEETAAALTQITAAVHSAAEGARNASAVVAEARGNAENSGRVVGDAVAAMGEIASSSSRITSIVGVIDDIAFQTNLLALNAGVEAARAGEAGRGFAVVASEVRALAQRSSEAAREIGGLIGTSAREVEKGVTLVGEAGEALRRIASSVNGISDHVRGIAASAQEQSASLGEVNASVIQLDQVTQQNAAMFEETTAASQNLVSQADALSARMARFRVGRAATPAARARPAPPAVPARREMQPAPQVRGSLALRPSDDDWEDF